MVLTANGATGALLEEAKNQDTKQSQISQVYIVATNSPTSEVFWNYPKLPRMLYEKDNGQCVNFARILSGINVKGNAIDWKESIDALKPELGAVVVFAYGHVAVVIGINYWKNTIIIRERNYIGKWIVSEREISSEDKKIVGYVLKTHVKQGNLVKKDINF